MDASTRISQLKKELQRLNHEYYVLGNSSASDADYDKLYNELISLENRFPELVDPDSPTQRVGAPIKGTSTVRHATRMLSLKNTYNATEVLDFFQLGTEVCVEPKIDGVSLKVIYRHGRFHQAITRGDGFEGEDATAAAKTIRSIPLNLGRDIDLIVVGEVYMRLSTFNKLNEQLEAQGEDLMANPRNAAAGSLKLKDPKEVASRSLSFVAYGLHTDVENVTTQAGVTNFLEVHGFHTMNSLPFVDKKHGKLCQVVRLRSEEYVKECIEDYDRRRQALDMQTDGLVLKINDLDRQRDLGDSTKYPNHSCAYKFPPERKETELLDITIQVGRTGKITPVAELRPLSLSGTTVKRASLCNGDEIARLGVNIGDVVGVEKSAEIIPKVMSVVKKKSTGTYAMPTRCPSCGNGLVKPNGYVDIFCENRNCDEQVFARLKHSCGKSALDIDGCGEAMVRELMRHGVRSLYAMFTIENLSFLKPAARQKFDIGRDKAKRAPYWRKLHALGIDGLGASLCQDIAARWSDLDAALETLDWDEAEQARRRKEGLEYRTVRDIIGDVNTEELVNWLTRNIDELGKLEDIGFSLCQGNNANAKLAGKVFVITGTLMSGQRSEVQDRIISAGGVVKGSISKAVNYLVMGADAGKTKTEAAKKNGVTVITEEQLYEMMGEAVPVIDATEKEY